MAHPTFIGIVLSTIWSSLLFGTLSQVRADDLLKRSDVILSPRMYQDAWDQQFTDFLATRISWTYSGAKYVPIGKERGFPVGCTLPFWVPPTDPNANAMKCYTKDGIALTRKFN